MASVTDLRDVVDVVIGVDTHSAAAVDARTGGVLGEVTVEATADGYAQLTEFADAHAALRAWAIEGTGGHGAGLARHLERREEAVIEFDRPERAKRRNKSVPLDAIRAPVKPSPVPSSAPRAVAGPPGAVGAARRTSFGRQRPTDAQRQLFSLVIAAPEPIRARFRGQKLPAMLRTLGSPAAQRGGERRDHHDSHHVAVSGPPRPSAG